MTDSLTTQLLARFDTIDAKFGAMETRFEAAYTRLEARLDNIELEIIDMKNEQRLMRHALVDQLDDVERLKRLHPGFSHS